MINLNKLLKLNPCKDRIDNYKVNYGKRNFTYKQFLNLKGITFDDKMWVVKKVIDDVDFWVVFAFDCAINVSHLNPYNTEEEYFATAWSAAYSAAYSAATYAAESAAYSAATYAAESARSATYAAESARSATYAAESARSAAKERQRQLEVLKYLITAFKLERK